MRPVNRRASGTVIAAVAMAAVVITAVAVTRGDRDAIRVQTSEVTTGPIARRVLVSGTLEPGRMVEVGSQVSGTVASMAVDFNSRVKAGQVLARVDPAAFETRLAEAEAGLAKARAERAQRQAALDDASMKLEDARALAGDQQLARAERDAARTATLQAAADVKAAEADIAAARAAVTQARISLDRAIIRSPIDGVVLGRHVDVGQTIAASVHAPMLFTIGDLRRMRLLAEVPEGEVGGLQPGSQVTFDIESVAGGAFTGTVAEVRLAPQVAPATAASTATAGATAPAATSGSTAAATGAGGQPAGSTPAGGTPTQPGGQASAVPPPATATPSTKQAAGVTGVVTYVAVIDVDGVTQDVPPGGTAIVTLAGSKRTHAVRVANNALTFAPSPGSLAAIDQEPPVLKRTGSPTPKHARTRQGFVWKFENERFVPIAIETGIADESWTELVSGDVRPGDRLVTAAVPLRRSRQPR